jgi:two-component system LytT family response regulator
MKCIAIDDEPLALRQISGYIQKTPFLELVKACPDATEALAILSEVTIDIMFVDINMPGLNGLDFVRSLAKRPLVIFTTAYSEYAIEGYKVDAQDYLLKPFGYNEFLTSAQKAHQRFEERTSLEKLTPQDDSIWVRSEYRTVRIPLQDVLYIEGMKDYVRIHLSDAKPIMTLTSLKALEELLPSNRFMRIHRSWIVATQKITLIEKGAVVIAGKHTIPLGDQYKDVLSQITAGRIVV